MSGPYPHLLSPGKIGGHTLRNRVVMAPIDSILTTEDGASNERHRAYLAARAKGGVGLIITDNMTVEYPRGAVGSKAVRIDQDRYIAALSEVAEEVHFWGAKVVAQINHSGRQTTLGATQGNELVSASPIGWPGSDGVPRALTVDEIQELVEAFADAAVRVQQAHFDGVEVHAAHGYLLSAFLSPALNKRTDQYGGSTENRARIVVEIVRAIRERTKPGFLVLVRLNVRDGLPGGMTPEEAVKLAKIFEEAGVDALDISAGTYESSALTFPSFLSPDGVLLDDISMVTKAVNIPVIGVGKVHTPEKAEQAIADGKADFIALGRALIADPDWVAKAENDSAESIRACIACNNGCIHRIDQNLTMQCNVNPYIGREWQLPLIRPVAGKRILVVGAGPAGAESALRAHELGHKVLIVEATHEIGGQLAYARVPEFKKELGRLVTYYEKRLADEGITVELGVRATPEWIEEYDPDEVVLATGSVPLIPRHLANAPGYTYEDAFRGKADLTRSVVVLGAGSIGCEVALYAAQQGASVTIVEREAEWLQGVDPTILQGFTEAFDKYSISVETGLDVRTVEKDRLVAYTADGKEVVHNFETLVFSTGRKPNLQLANELNGRRRVHLVGDCVEVASLLEATRRAAYLAERI